MRREDRDKLQRPYPEGTPSPNPFADAVGVVLPSVRELHHEVFSDLDDMRYGIGWRASTPATTTWTVLT